MKITPDIIEQINILYLEIGVKKRVAEIVGCSPSTVSKYIIPNFQPPAQPIESNFDEPIGDASTLAATLKISDSPVISLLNSCTLTQEEWTEMRELQKGVMV